MVAWSSGAVERQAQLAVVEHEHVLAWRLAHPRPDHTPDPGDGLPVLPDPLPGLEVVTDADGVARVIGRKLIR